MSGVRVGIVGPLLEDHVGWVPSPGRRLADLLAQDGLAVRTTSAHVDRLRRTIDVASVAVSWRRAVDVGVVMVFSGDALRLSRLAMRTVRAAGARTVAWLHGGGLPAHHERRPRHVDALLGAADAVVAPSPWLAGWARGLGHPAWVVPNVVEPGPSFRARTHLRPRVLWMRTYHALYDPLLAVAAFERIHAARPDARLTMAGQDKGLRATVVEEVRRLGLSGVVDVRGFVDADAKSDLFAEHDVFLSTNRVDNAPVTVVEAGLAGLPVVALDVGGLADLLDHGEGGVLVDRATPAATADAVLDLLDDPVTAARVVAAGRRRGEEHRWAAVGPSWHDLLGEVAGA